MKTVAMENAQWGPALWIHTQLILRQLCVFPQKRLQFSRRQCKQTERGREKACKARSLLCQSTTKAPRVINKMVEKTASLLGGMLVCSHHDMTRERLGRSIAVLYGKHALHQLSTTRVPEVNSTLHLRLHWIYFRMTSRPVYTHGQ